MHGEGEKMVCSHLLLRLVEKEEKLDLLYIFCGLRCVGHSFAYVAHFTFLRDVWIRF
jgi:hypothetical protein